jgi:hypothetical protein
VSSLGFGGDLCFGIAFVEPVCAMLHWLHCSKSIVEKQDQCDCCDYLAGRAAHWNCFAELVFESLHTDVSVDNQIDDEGARALGDALKDNTTLTSFSLELYCEWSWFRW